MKRLRFTADMTKEQKRNTVEAALLLGFQAETAVLYDNKIKHLLCRWWE